MLSSFQIKNIGCPHYPGVRSSGKVNKTKN